MPEILTLVNFYYSKLHFYQTTAEKEKVYHVNPKSKTILIINGAGGVGSVATQLAHLAGLTVIATASRPDSIKWTQDYGTDYVVNHREDLVKTAQIML